MSIASPPGIESTRMSVASTIDGGTPGGDARDSRPPSLGTGGSSSDDGSSSTAGPVWMEDPSPLKRKSRAIGMWNRGSPSADRKPSADNLAQLQRSPPEVIAMFNGPKSVEKQMKALMDEGHLGEGSPEEIAAFLLQNDGKLELSRVGDYVGGGDDGPKLVLRAMLRTLDFADVPIDSALRKFIALVKLPGESQKIDRIITCFAERCVAQSMQPAARARPSPTPSLTHAPGTWSATRAASSRWITKTRRALSPSRSPCSTSTRTTTTSRSRRR